MRNIFGSDYPPGCHSTPFDEPCICLVCGYSDDNCICPECPICGEQGNPDCYKPHLTMNEKQLAGKARLEEDIRQQHEQDNALYELHKANQDPEEYEGE